MKNSKTAENGTPHGRATGRAPRAEEPKLAQLAHGQPCQAARPAVRGGTVVPVVWHDRAGHPPRAVFALFVFLFGFSLYFWGCLSSTSCRAFLG